MTLKAQLTSDLSVFFDENEFAQAVTYNGAPINVVVDYGKDQDMDNNSNATKAVMFVKVSDVASPEYRDTVVINTVTWYVLNILDGDGYIWKINLYRDERPHAWV